MPDINTTNKGDRDNKASSFNPRFALPDGEFLTVHAGDSSIVIDGKEIEIKRTMLSMYLQIPEDEVTLVQIFGYKILEGMVTVDGDFEAGFWEAEEGLPRLDYTVKMSRRDDLIQHISYCYTMSILAVDEDLADYPDKPEDYRFESSEQAQNFYKTLIDYEVNNKDFRKFLGAVLGHYQTISGDGEWQNAVVAVVNFLYFNHFLPSSDSRRKFVLNRIGVPDDKEIMDVDLMNKESFEKFLADEDNSFDQARKIAAYFAQLNARPYDII